MYSTDAVADAARYWEPRYAASDAQAKAESEAVERVMHLVRRGDTLASYEHSIIDGGRGNHTLAAVLADSLEWLDGTATPELLMLLIDAANGKSVEVAARDLIRKAATKWAHMTVEAA